MWACKYVSIFVGGIYESVHVSICSECEDVPVCVLMYTCM